MDKAEMEKIWQQTYGVARKMDPELARKYAEEARCEEERKFWNYVLNMRLLQLQRLTKEARHKLYKASVGPGWWPILDKYIPKILEADPDARLYIKEKYGFLRIEMSCSHVDLQKQIDWENEAEQESSTVCEWCGAPGKHRTDGMWYLTLCDRCNGVRGDNGLKDIIIEGTERRWLDGKMDPTD